MLPTPEPQLPTLDRKHAHVDNTNLGPTLKKKRHAISLRRPTTRSQKVTPSTPEPLDLPELASAPLTNSIQDTKAGLEPAEEADPEAYNPLSNSSAQEDCLQTIVYSQTSVELSERISSGKTVSVEQERVTRLETTTEASVEGGSTSNELSCRAPSSPETMMGATNSTATNSALSRVDTDCNEDNEDGGEGLDEFFDIDEIEDWDDDFGRIDPISSVPDSTCPICGLDFGTLGTMKPDEHVNRCLDAPLDTTISSYSAATSVPTQVQDQVPPPMPTVSPKGPPPPNRTTAKPAQKPEKTYRPKASRPCPFYKKMPDTDFTVDAFCYGAVQGCNAYFLSHFHSDHYGGLTSTWSHGLIYCSSITANLVESRLRVDPKYVRRLPMFVPTVVNGVTVTLMDANHCPGSVLFVFDLQTPRRRYLHTGDFRALPDMALDPILRQPQCAPIDILYLDTTYINPRYTFPPQETVVRETVRLVSKELGLASDEPPALVAAPKKKFSIMESWLKKKSGNTEKLLSMALKPSTKGGKAQSWDAPTAKDKIMICVGTYLIGKERVFMAIARSLGAKVFVQPSKMQILTCLEDPELLAMLTSDPHQAQIHLLHMGSDMSPEALQKYLESLAPTFNRLIAIRPTGWTFSPTRVNEPPAIGPAQPPSSLNLRPNYTSSTIKIFPVPYSEHSSFSELAGFVRSLHIVKVIPTVGVGSEKGRHAMEAWFKRWEQERQQGVGWV